MSGPGDCFLERMGWWYLNGKYLPGLGDVLVGPHRAVLQWEICL